ncbi:C40 family peptidase [Serpentinicella sp. ANB-PHB4]|uniref:C40 family peptidase n=1 Tax=Serpentinicella sp. ANB-PHB4 TaxID=3074076 RepID=UPI00286172BF|nr:C40 family peptidase [Serpentinicella sp. ANB-PHB4]MDR5658827.1 C40 family peptidase [Serpentinicella sp. ANB-PHB4]
MKENKLIVMIFIITIVISGCNIQEKSMTSEVQSNDGQAIEPMEKQLEMIQLEEEESIDIKKLESEEIKKSHNKKEVILDIDGNEKTEKKDNITDEEVEKVVNEEGTKSDDLHYKNRENMQGTYTQSKSEITNPVVKKAVNLLGAPYKHGGNSLTEGFNTINFVRHVHKEAYGIHLTRISQRLFEKGIPVARSDLSPGDILFFQGESLMPGIYKEEDDFIVQTTSGVQVVNLKESKYWAPRYVGARRLTEKDFFYLNPNNFSNHSNPVIREAIKYIGTPYVLTGESLSGFDCSFLVQMTFENALKVYLPRITYNQWEVGQTIDYSNIRPGDVIYFSGTWQDGISHTGIYLGDNYMIHASGDERETTISYLCSYWMDKFTGVKRFDAMSIRLDHPIVAEAYKHLGAPYLIGGNNNNGFNTSGFVQYVMKQSVGIELPRTAAKQWEKGIEIEKTEIKIGDTLFFKGDSGLLLPGIYIDNDQFIVVTESTGVEIRDLYNSPYWTPRFIGARRHY